MFVTCLHDIFFYNLYREKYNKQRVEHATHPEFDPDPGSSMVAERLWPLGFLAG
jgi:hypothetical protein